MHLDAHVDTRLHCTGTEGVAHMLKNWESVMPRLLQNWCVMFHADGSGVTTGSVFVEILHVCPPMHH